MFSTKVNTANAVFCSVSLFCGVTLSILVTKIRDYINGEENSTLLWLVGFSYIIPGAAGIVATGLRNKISYIVHSLLGFLAMVNLIILFFKVLPQVRNTKRVHVCDFSSCEDYVYLARMIISSDAMFFGGGIATLVSAIMSTILASCVSNTFQQQGNATTGTVLSYVNQGGPQYQINQISGLPYQVNQISEPWNQINKISGPQCLDSPNTLTSEPDQENISTSVP